MAVLDAPSSSRTTTWATAEVEAWWVETFGQLTARRYVRVRGRVGGVDAEVDASACGVPGDLVGGASYCPTDESLLWDEEVLMGPVEAGWGRLGVGLVVAHEWAHVAQAQGLPWGEWAIEDQADCLAGAWARDAAGAGAFDPIPTEAAVAAGERAVLEVAGVAVADHDARVASVITGWRGGPEACAPTAVRSGGTP